MQSTLQLQHTESLSFKETGLSVLQVHCRPVENAAIENARRECSSRQALHMLQLGEELACCLLMHTCPHVCASAGAHPPWCCTQLPAHGQQANMQARSQPQSFCQVGCESHLSLYRCLQEC
jgi:hypothetical protein